MKNHYNIEGFRHKFETVSKTSGTLCLIGYEYDFYIFQPWIRLCSLWNQPNSFPRTLFDLLNAAQSQTEKVCFSCCILNNKDMCCTKFHFSASRISTFRHCSLSVTIIKADYWDTIQKSLCICLHTVL